MILTLTGFAPRRRSLMPLVAAFISLMTSSAAAQSRTSQPGSKSTPPAKQSASAPLGSGRIEGDVYLVMQSGDTKRGAGRVIYLIPGEPGKLSKVHSALCDAYEARYAELKERQKAATEAWTASISSGSSESGYAAVKASSDSVFALFEVTTAAIDAYLTQTAVARVSTGMNAHYSFANVRPGRYNLFGEWKIGEHNYQWWAPAVVGPGQHVKLDLDNSVEAAGTVYCGIK